MGGEHYSQTGGNSLQGPASWRRVIPSPENPGYSVAARESMLAFVSTSRHEMSVLPN